MEAPQRPRVAILASPGMGHLIPLVELARRLVQQHSNFTATFIVPSDIGSPLKPQKALLESLHPSIDSIFLPPVDCGNIPANKAIENRIILTVIKSLPALRNSLSELSRSTRVSALVVDTFGVLSLDFVKELGIPLYVFFTSNAMALSFFFHLPELDESCSCEYRDLPEPVTLPGCVPLNGSDLLDPVQDRKNEAYKGFLGMTKKIILADGILINSFLNLEPKTFEALEQAGSSNRPPVYPVGPFIRPGSDTSSFDDKPKCLKWLDEQPPGSVLFVSFGSGGTLSKEQLNELALGLQMSQQRFLWVVRRPNDKVKNAAFFSVAENKTDPFEHLSPDFMEKTKGKGFVVAQWAPQIEVLGHPAVDGFLTHCGWNSILESIVYGVPLIAWPLYAEQRMNAGLLSEDLKVAFRVRENENGVVESEQIARLARSLIEGEEGEELRNRMRNLKEAAAMALCPDGSSSKSLANVAAKWLVDASRI